MRIFVFLMLWLSLEALVSEGEAASASADPAVRTLLARYADLCLEAYPKKTSVAAKINALGMAPVNMAHYLSVTHGAAVQGWKGDLGGVGPNPTREMDLVIASSPRPGCSVATRVSRDTEDLPEFQSMVLSFVAKRSHGRFVDASASVASASAKLGFTFYHRFEWLSDSHGQTEQFVASEQPAPDGREIQIQLARVINGP